MLSRVEGVSEAIDMEQLARTRRTAKDTARQTGLKLKKVPIPGTETGIYCDMKTKIPRPYITQIYRKQAFTSLHGLAHPGVKATIKLVTERYVWPNIRSDCKRWAQACIPKGKLADITRYQSEVS